MPNSVAHIPTSEGFYWAKTSGYQWFNLIIRIHGESPFLHIDAWEYVERRVIADIHPYEIAEVGPLISDLIDGPQ